MKRIHRKMLGVLCVIPSAALFFGGMRFFGDWQMIGRFVGVAGCFVVIIVSLWHGLELMFEKPDRS